MCVGVYCQDRLSKSISRYYILHTSFSITYTGANDDSIINEDNIVRKAHQQKCYNRFSANMQVSHLETYFCILGIQLFDQFWLGDQVHMNIAFLQKRFRILTSIVLISLRYGDTINYPAAPHAMLILKVTLCWLLNLEFVGEVELYSW